MNSHTDTTIPLTGCRLVGEGTSDKVLNWTARSLNHLHHHMDDGGLYIYSAKNVLHHLHTYIHIPPKFCKLLGKQLMFIDKTL